MSSDNKYERLFKLWATLAKLVLDGKRDIDVVIGLLQAVVNESQTQQLSVTPRWRLDADGFIRFTLTTTRETGAEWVDWFRANNYDIDPDVESILLSSSFWPSRAGTIYNIAVLPGNLWKDVKRTTKNIRVEADRWHLKHNMRMTAEVTCLIRRTFSDQEISAMGLTWIVVLQERIIGSDGNSYLLCADSRLNRLGKCYANPGMWPTGYGFAAVISVVSPK